jgi:Spy/CpxP family protein refolding chaperone
MSTEITTSALASKARRGDAALRRGRVWFGLRAVACCVLTLVSIAVTPRTASAQFGPMSGSQMMPEAVTKRGLDAYVRILGLDKDQAEAAKALYDGHQTAYRNLQKESMDKMQALTEKARESGDFAMIQKQMPAMMKEITTKGEGLEDGFFSDLKSLCNDQQTANWDTVLHHHRREKAMRFGFVSGSAVDLISVMEKLKLKPTSESEAKETLLQYELEIDKLLVVFEKMGKDAQKDMFESGSMFDMKKVEEMMRKFYESASSVRDVNRNYARRLETVLGDDDKAKLAEEIKRRSFPKIYKTSHTQQVFDTAMGLADLSKDQKEQLVPVKEAYLRELASVNEKWAKATEEKEEKAGGSIMVMIQSFQPGGGDPNDPVKLAKEARKELDSKTKEKVEAILTPAQVSKLPEKKSESFNPMADFMPAEDEEGADAGK